MAERTLREHDSAARASRTSAASSSPLVSRSAIDCPQGHEFEITMSVEADIPAIWECPRCGAEALSVGPGSCRRSKAEKPARTHWDMLLERRSVEGARGHPQGASRAAARRRDRSRPPAPREREEAKGVLAAPRRS